MDSLVNRAQAEFIEERANRYELVHWIKWIDKEYLLEVRRLEAEVERLRSAIVETKQAMEWRYPILNHDQCGFTTEESNAYHLLCRIIEEERWQG